MVYLQEGQIYICPFNYLQTIEVRKRNFLAQMDYTQLTVEHIMIGGSLPNLTELGLPPDQVWRLYEDHLESDRSKNRLFYRPHTGNREPFVLVGLTLSDSFNSDGTQPLRLESLPASLTVLFLGRNNQQVVESAQLPPFLERLVFSHTQNKAPINILDLPRTLRTLSLPPEYNWPIDYTALPPALQRLHMGNIFLHGTDIARLPRTLQYLGVCGIVGEIILDDWPDLLHLEVGSISVSWANLPRQLRKYRCQGFLEFDRPSDLPPCIESIELCQVDHNLDWRTCSSLRKLKLTTFVEPCQVIVPLSVKEINIPSHFSPIRIDEMPTSLNVISSGKARVHFQREEDLCVLDFGCK